MVAVVDVGNTNIHVGLYKHKSLIRHLTHPLSETALESKILSIVSNKNIEGAAIASVVPRLTPRFVQFFKKKLSISPLLISPDIECHLTFGYHRPHQLGADRIASAVGGLARYKRDLIIIDFGTATTLNIVHKNRFYEGGIIIPGVETLRDALTKQAAQIKEVHLKRPRRLVGRSTEECVQSGIYNGTIAMVGGFIQAIRRKHKKKFLCVATGGWGKEMASQIKEITRYDSDLCLFGILQIYYYNV
jgi:type III pantothenate kinase